MASRRQLQCSGHDQANPCNRTAVTRNRRFQHAVFHEQFSQCLPMATQRCADRSPLPPDAEDPSPHTGDETYRHAHLDERSGKCALVTGKCAQAETLYGELFTCSAVYWVPNILMPYCQRTTWLTRAPAKESSRKPRLYAPRRAKPARGYWNRSIPERFS
jgi:hypothetical protein